MNNNFLQTWFQRMLQSTQKKTKGTVLKKREEKKNTKKQCLIESFVHPTLLTDRRVLANPSKRTATACHHFCRHTHTHTERERERERKGCLPSVHSTPSRPPGSLFIHSFIFLPSHELSSFSFSGPAVFVFSVTKTQQKRQRTRHGA